MSKLSEKINDCIAQHKTIEIEIHGSTHFIHGNSNVSVLEGKGCEYLEEIQSDNSIRLYNLATCTTICIK